MPQGRTKDAVEAKRQDVQALLAADKSDPLAYRHIADQWQGGGTALSGSGFTMTTGTNTPANYVSAASVAR